MAGRRLTLLQTTEVKFALDKIKQYLDGGNAEDLRLASAQLETFLREEGYRKQHAAHAVGFNHDDELGVEHRG